MSIYYKEDLLDWTIQYGLVRPTKAVCQEPGSCSGQYIRYLSSPNCRSLVTDVTTGQSIWAIPKHGGLLFLRQLSVVSS